jgi:hypothetical protein
MPGQQERRILFAMPRITISYRRDDSLDITGRIFDRLAGHFGREAVFRDIDSIPLGADFRRHIDRVLGESDIILAIVGPRWIGPDNEHLRLASPADPVRLEIETALGKDKPLIPVLVSHAGMPDPDVLPDSLRDFAYRNAVQVDSGQDFDVHVSRLIRAIEGHLRIDEERAAAVRGVIPAIEAPPPMEPTPEVEPPVEPTRSQVGWSVVPPDGRRTVRWVLGLVVILGIIGASGWWVLVEQPAEMARREAAGFEKARAEYQASQAAAAAKAQQEEQARQAAAAAKAQQEERERQAAAAAKALQEERDRQAAAAAKAQQEEQARQAAAEAKAQQEEQARLAAAAAKAKQEEQARQAAEALKSLPKPDIRGSVSAVESASRIRVGEMWLDLYGVSDPTQRAHTNEVLGYLLPSLGAVECYQKTGRRYQCYADGKDLALLALRDGLARAAADAPEEYRSVPPQQKSARH